MNNHSVSVRILATGALAAVSISLLVTGILPKANGQESTQSSSASVVAAPKKDPYYVSVMLDDTFTQEFRIQSDDNVCSGSKVGNTNWRVEIDPHQNADRSVSLQLKLGKVVLEDTNGKLQTHGDSFNRFARFKLDEEPRRVSVPLPSTSSWQIKKVVVSVSSHPGVSADAVIISAPVK